LFDWLDQPVQRVTGGEAAPSISKVLERAAIAQTSDVVGGLERVRAAFGGGAAPGSSGREGLGADSWRQSSGTSPGISPAAPASRPSDEVRR
jgi:hypothetical protein